MRLLKLLETKQRLKIPKNNLQSFRTVREPLTVKKFYGAGISGEKFSKVHEYKFKHFGAKKIKSQRKEGTLGRILSDVFEYYPVE